MDIPVWIKKHTWQTIAGGCIVIVVVVISIVLLTSKTSNQSSRSFKITGKDGAAKPSQAFKIVGKKGTAVQTGSVSGTAASIGGLKPEALAKKLLTRSSIDRRFTESKENKEALTGTLEGLARQADDAIKMGALKSLKAGDVAEATELLIDAAPLHNKQAAYDWIDIGNISLLIDTQKAQRAFEVATEMDSANALARQRLDHLLNLAGQSEDAGTAVGKAKSPAGEKAVSGSTGAGKGLVPEELAGAILVQGPDQQIIRKKEEEILVLSATIERLRQYPDDVLKRQALEALSAQNMAKAAELIEKAIRAKAEPTAQDWIDLGNIAFFTDTKKALGAYDKAVEIDPDNAVAWIRKADLLMRQGQLDAAEKGYSKVVALGKADQPTLSSAYRSLGDIQMMRRQPENAEVNYLLSLEIEKALGHREGMADHYGNLGVISMERGQLAKAEVYLLKALEIETALGRQENLASACGRLGAIYQKRRQPDKAEKYLLRAIDIETSLGRMENVANHYVHLGIGRTGSGELDKAAAYLLKALKIETLLGRKEQMAQDNGILGVVYTKSDQPDKAEQHLLKAIEIEESLGRKANAANQLGNLAALYKTNEQSDKAEAAYLKCLEINAALGRKKHVARDSVALAMIYQKSGRLDKAEVYYLKYIEIAEALGSQKGLATQYGNLGIVYRTQGKFENAEAAYLKALGIEKTLGRKAGIAKNTYQLGLTFQATGELDKAEAYHRESLEIAKTAKNKMGQALNYNNLGAIYQQGGQSYRACEEWEKSRDLFEEIMASDRAEKVAQLIAENCNK